MPGAGFDCIWLAGILTLAIRVPGTNYWGQVDRPYIRQELPKNFSPQQRNPCCLRQQLIGLLEVKLGDSALELTWGGASPIGDADLLEEINGLHCGGVQRAWWDSARLKFKNLIEMHNRDWSQAINQALASQSEVTQGQRTMLTSKHFDAFKAEFPSVSMWPVAAMAAYCCTMERVKTNALKGVKHTDAKGLLSGCSYVYAVLLEELLRVKRNRLK